MNDRWGRQAVCAASTSTVRNCRPSWLHQIRSLATSPDLGGLMVSQANRLAGSSQARRFKNSLGISLVAGLVLSALPMGEQSLAYDGPTFSKGMWLFQRSTEFVTKHWVLPNARRVKVEQPVVRCVNPTEAMIETFRPVNVGACQSTLPERKK